jgi:hypothetical protein
MSAAVIPEPIAQLQLQVEQIRSTQPRERDCRIQCGKPQLNWPEDTVCIPSRIHLRLDYAGLKKRLGGVSPRRRETRKPTFVELFAPPSAMQGECLIEFESLRGSKVRIQWKAATSPDWMGLLRAWRETER